LGRLNIGHRREGDSNGSKSCNEQQDGDEGVTPSCGNELHSGKAFLGCGKIWCYRELLQDINHEKERNPNNINEMPVVGNNYCASGLFMGEAFRYVGGGQDQKERNQAPGYVHPMKTGGDVKGGSVGI
jgi:hypothetical protein